MKLSKWLPVALILMTAILAVVYIGSRDKVPEGAIAVENGERVIYVTTTDLETEDINTELTDAKGETYQFSASGVEVSAVLIEADIDPTAVNQVTVVASDAYSAVVSGVELAEENKVYLLLREGENPELIVLGDANRKRNVSNVERLLVS